MTWCIPLSKGRQVTIIRAYAPTLVASEQDKDKFYSSLGVCLQEIHRTDRVLLLGDFNDRIGHDVLGKHGVLRVNNNGLRFLTLCSYHLL